MLTYKEFKAQWTPSEEHLRQGYATQLKGERFWDLAYRNYTRTYGYATINIVPSGKGGEASH